MNRREFLSVAASIIGSTALPSFCEGSPEPLPSFEHHWEVSFLVEDLEEILTSSHLYRIYTRRTAYALYNRGVEIGKEIGNICTQIIDYPYEVKGREEAENAHLVIITCTPKDIKNHFFNWRVDYSQKKEGEYKRRTLLDIPTEHESFLASEVTKELEDIMKTQRETNNGEATGIRKVV